MSGKPVIWIVLNSEDTQGRTSALNAQGCKQLCDSRIQSQADMLYVSLLKQAQQLKEGDPIVMHQGGGRQYGSGAAHFVAAGIVSNIVQPLTPAIVKGYRQLWEVTKKWHKNWPANPAQIKGEQFIRYQLKRSKKPILRPDAIRPRNIRGKNKFIPLHPNCTLHPECSAYNAVYEWWYQNK